MSVCPKTGSMEKWFRPLATDDDLSALTKGCWGEFVVSRQQRLLGSFEIAFMRGRRGYLDMDENLVTSRQPVRPQCNPY
jgi:hypothetical protein